MNQMLSSGINKEKANNQSNNNKEVLLKIKSPLLSEDFFFHFAPVQVF